MPAQALPSPIPAPTPPDPWSTSKAPSPIARQGTLQLLQVHPLRTNPGPSCPHNPGQQAQVLPVGPQRTLTARTGNALMANRHCRRKRDTLRLESQAVPENMPGAPPPQSPVHPGAYSTQYRAGEPVQRRPEHLLLNNAAGCLMACSNLGQRRVPFNLGLLTAHCLSSALGPQSTQGPGEPELRPGERGGNSSTYHEPRYRGRGR